MTDRWASVPALLAGPLAVVGLVLGLQATDFDAEAFRDPETVLALGASGADSIRASYLLVMLGSYLLLVPLAVRLHHALRDPADDGRGTLSLVAGLGYLGLGAAGACVLAAVWPDLIEQYGASGADRPGLVALFRTATRIAEDGLQGAVQNLAGAVWWLLLGLRLRAVGRRRLGALTLVLAVASALNTAGALLSADALTVPGLTVTVLLVPVWSFVLGLVLLRGRLTDVGQPGRST